VFPFTSRRVIETVEVALPFAVTGPVPVIVEFAATGEPATKATVEVTEVNPEGPVILKVFVSAMVEVIVPVACPEAFVTEAGWVREFPVPVAAKVVVTPLIGLLFTSRRVMVTVEVVLPSAVTPLEGEAEIVEFATTAEPGIKATVEVTPANPAGVAMLRVFVSATVDLIVPVATPEAFVTAAGWTNAFPVPVEANVVEAPLTGLPFASCRVIVTVDVAFPSALTPLEGDAEIVEFAAIGAPATKATVPVTVENPVGEAILIVLIAATVEAIVPVVCPEAFVTDPG